MFLWSIICTYIILLRYITLPLTSSIRTLLPQTYWIILKIPERILIKFCVKYLLYIFLHLKFIVKYDFFFSVRGTRRFHTVFNTLVQSIIQNSIELLSVSKILQQWNGKWRSGKRGKRPEKTKTGSLFDKNMGRRAKKSFQFAFKCRFGHVQVWPIRASFTRRSSVTT